ncbi:MULTISPECIES: DUF1287 domain-containing protein [unclassified Shinella]|jgi:uncharacterized protein YijF (DUF1287 family)|uniref:DUF1287 domain-containing protein n=1 Tax=unclassified Shinella TaxID=2643062 RepID=UPI000682E990|nr:MULTISPECIES: DUF1287 domain-containing protein [unclassified Shinella]KNY13965.1 hypothetical protein AKG11_26710 [Shinella sp. SUS2]KOC72727.1 hypothetical protein AKG10_25670 [Shinella sp. GWS1]MCO5154606.1 DUF1287 domain-containing protein [Shinella sp.]MDC7263878.1 DUF1287 domain-containing protein [Shinella sp. HY16]MDC7270774.1 DUF1287 domain-containing protein [Shinella sp. YZ44]
MLFRRALLAGGLVSGAAFVLPASLRAQPAEDDAQKLVAAARQQIGVTLTYDPAYSRLDYPGGDVPRARGVCTDVIVRAYRDGLAIDLQVLVHEDMRRAFSAYPPLWGLKRTDRNIDHRRVPNLQAFLKRQGAALPVSKDGADYRPGDIVSQMLPGNLPHIGIVADARSADGARPLLVHNIGAGARLEDVLFAYPLTGHYRYRV